MNTRIFSAVFFLYLLIATILFFNANVLNWSKLNVRPFPYEYPCELEWQKSLGHSNRDLDYEGLNRAFDFGLESCFSGLHRRGKLVFSDEAHSELISGLDEMEAKAVSLGWNFALKQMNSFREDGGDLELLKRSMLKPTLGQRIFFEFVVFGFLLQIVIIGLAIIRNRTRERSKKSEDGNSIQKAL